jgi:hypothetical protein
MSVSKIGGVWVAQDNRGCFDIQPFCGNQEIRFKVFSPIEALAPIAEFGSVAAFAFENVLAQQVMYTGVPLNSRSCRVPIVPIT